jgi:hypothetical protein
MSAEGEVLQDVLVLEGSGLVGDLASGTRGTAWVVAERPGDSAWGDLRIGFLDPEPTPLVPVPLPSGALSAGVPRWLVWDPDHDGFVVPFLFRTESGTGGYVQCISALER